MKISLGLLRRYVDINVPVDELCDKMIMSGFEVESVEDLSLTMKNIVAARILKLEPHPDADRLQLCTMDVGAAEPIMIVTGATNVFEGALVPACLHNSLLPDGTKITRGKLRGVMSEGMLCSGAELGLTEHDYPGAEVHGILILDEDCPTGTDMREILGLFDTVIDFKITANRPDCQSVLGVAREISVALGTEFLPPVPEFKTSPEKVGDFISVQVKDFDLCPRYCGSVVRNIKIARSPAWMRHALSAAGMRPINNIVDITNFVMLETGYPMHAFDMRDIKGSKIIVRRAADGESITTLDEKEHKLTSEMLVIADGDEPSCLAGIMGGANSEIKDDTHDVFFECAKFRRDSVRRTSRALGVRTESSSRFERGLDIMGVENALRRADQLICELGAGEVADGIIDINDGLPAPRSIDVSVSGVNGLLGLSIPAGEMVRILCSLCINTTLSGDTLHCEIPSFREDIEGLADIAEEVMRIYGYDHIVGTPMTGLIVRGRKLPERIDTDRVKSRLIAAGYSEIATYSFISGKAVDTLRLSADDSRRKAVTIINPLSEEYSTMRTQLVTSMLSVFSTNFNRKVPSAALFEASKLFIPKELPLKSQPYELPSLCVGAYGDEYDFFTMKGVVEDVLGLFGVHEKCAPSHENYYHPGRQAEYLLDGKRLAVFGEIHPETANAYSIGTRVYVAEIDLALLFAQERKPVLFRPLPKFPSVERDFALLCDLSLPVGTLEDAIRRGAGHLCENIRLFDIYTGSQIPDGKKSVAFTVSLRSSESTLSEEQITAASRKIIDNLSALGAELRS